MEKDATPLLDPAYKQSLFYRLELPTWAVATVIYSGWLAVTWYYSVLPAPVVAVLGTVLVAWHGSLRHECVHGHPFNFKTGDIVAGPPLNLLDPFALYRKYHLIHHNNAMLTYPGVDPESYYQLAENWEKYPAWRRLMLRFNQTFPGRMIVGPLNAYIPWYYAEMKKLLAGNTEHARIWAMHGLGVAVVLYWAVVICGMPLWFYLLFFVYFSTSLGMVRSFYEHRYHESPDGRSVIVENGRFFHLLFLCNSFHVIHHAHPNLPWFVMKKLYRENPEKWQKLNDGFVEPNYRTLMCRHFFKPTFVPPHPIGNPPKNQVQEG